MAVRDVFPFIFRYICLVNEKNSVGAFHLALHDLGKASKLVPV